jgi:Ca2+-transporting ATPase
MAGMTLWIYQIGQISFGSPQIGQTMALISLSLMNIFLALNLRFPEDTAFQISTFLNHRLLYAYLWVILGSILMTETRLFQALFGTTSLTAYQWGLCLIPGAVLLILGEIFKVSLRYRGQNVTVPV